MKKLLCVLLLSIAVLSCSVNPSELPKGYAKSYAQKMQFTKIKVGQNDVCFGFVATRKTGDTDQNGLGAVWVPCELVEAALTD